jgi:hypothetical protein
MSSDGYTIFTGNAQARGPDNSNPAAIGVPIQVWIQSDGYTITSATSFQQPLEVITNAVTFLLDGYGSYNNTATFKALQIDGYGGNVSTAPPGDLIVSNNALIDGYLTVDGIINAGGNAIITGSAFVTGALKSFTSAEAPQLFLECPVTTLTLGSTITPTSSFHVASTGVNTIQTINLTNFNLSSTTSSPVFILCDGYGAGLSTNTSGNIQNAVTSKSNITFVYNQAFAKWFVVSAI